MHSRIALILDEGRTINESFTAASSGVEAAVSTGIEAAASIAGNTAARTKLLDCFCSLFPLRLSSVLRHGENGKWFELSRFHYLSDEEIIQALASGSKLERGFRFDSKTAFLVLQIPEASFYHQSEPVKKLRAELARFSIATRHYQINSDWYLYIFLDEFANSERLGELLSNWLESKGYIVSDSTLQVHPSGDFIPFPLQRNFYWMNDCCQLLIGRDELSLDDAVAFFFDDAKDAIVSSAQFLEKLSAVKQKTEAQAPDKFALDEFSLFEPDSQDGSRLIIFDEIGKTPAQTIPQELEVPAEALKEESSSAQAQLLIFPQEKAKQVAGSKQTEGVDVSYKQEQRARKKNKRKRK